MRNKSLLVILMIMILAFPTVATAKLAPGDFIDIHGHWAEQGIQSAYDLGLMKGTGITTQGFKVFSPEGKVTRSQLVSVLVRSFDLNYDHIRFFKEPVASDYFRDINNDAWFADAAMLCAINKVLPDYQDRNFRSEATITRIELANALYRSFNAKRINVPMVLLMPSYQDMQGFSSEDMNAMVFVSNTGIMKGDNNYFYPNAAVTRAELATVLVRCNKILAMHQSPLDQSGEVKVNSLVDLQLTDTLEVDLNIPQLEGLSDKGIQSSINNRFTTDANNFKNEIQSGLSEYVKNAEIGNYPVHPFAVVSRFQSGVENSKLLSLYVDYYQYTGGAHGLTGRHAYNWNLVSGQELALKDIFQANYDYGTVINQYIREQISLQPEIYFTGDMGFQGLKANQDFYLEPGYLVVYFQQYDIAPYASGIREFKIPLSEFGDEFIIETIE